MDQMCLNPKVPLGSVCLRRQELCDCVCPQPAVRKGFYGMPTPSCGMMEFQVTEGCFLGFIGLAAEALQ